MTVDRGSFCDNVFMHVFVRIMRIIFRVSYCSFDAVKGLFLEIIFESFNLEDESKVAFIKIETMQLEIQYSHC